MITDMTDAEWEKTYGCKKPDKNDFLVMGDFGEFSVERVGNQWQIIYAPIGQRKLRLYVGSKPVWWLGEDYSSDRT